MIVVGVDPGARETGIAVVDTTRGVRGLLASTTVRRDEPGVEPTPLLDVPPAYLLDVVAAIRDALAPGGSVALTDDPEAIAVEAVKRPSWRHAGRVKPTDPTAIIATGFVAGAILGRSWPAPVLVVPTGGNGSQALGSYPDELVTAAERRGADWRLRRAGDGKLRHERSAYDVALAAPMRLALAVRTGRIYP